MFIDLNVPVPVPLSLPSQPSKKGKGKQSAQVQAPAVVFSPAQISALEARIDLLHYRLSFRFYICLNYANASSLCHKPVGYTIVAFNQLVHKRVDPKIHVNILDPLLSQLRKREDIVYLKRLTIVLDEDSEKGFGLVRLLSRYLHLPAHICERLQVALLSSPHTISSLFYLQLQLPSLSPALPTPFPLPSQLTSSPSRSPSLAFLSLLNILSSVPRSNTAVYLRSPTLPPSEAKARPAPPWSEAQRAGAR